MLIVNSQGCALRKIEGLSAQCSEIAKCRVSSICFLWKKKKKKKNHASLISQEQKEGARGHQVLLRARLCQWIAWRQCKNLIIGNVTLSLPGITKRDFPLTTEIYVCFRTESSERQEKKHLILHSNIRKICGHYSTETWYYDLGSDRDGQRCLWDAYSSLGLRVLFIDNHYRIYLSEESILYLLKAKKGFLVDHLISKHVRCSSILLQQLS